MAEIFHKASGVVVWLGQEDIYTADAFEVMQKVSVIQESDWSGIEYTSFYEPKAIKSCNPDLTYYNWLGFITFINRPWFQRAWVGDDDVA